MRDDFRQRQTFGGGYLTDPTTGDSILVYGSTTTDTAITFDGTSGSPVFTWKNPKDAKESLAGLEEGDLIEVVAMNAYYASQNLPEINCVITSINGNPEYTYTASVGEVENGTVQLSKSSGLAYGEEVTATITPAAGYKIDQAYVEDAHGGKTDLVDGKFKATCVNKVVVTFADEAASKELHYAKADAFENGKSYLIGAVLENKFYYLPAQGAKDKNPAAIDGSDLTGLGKDVAWDAAVSDDGVRLSCVIEGTTYYLAATDTAQGIKITSDEDKAGYWTLTAGGLMHSTSSKRYLDIYPTAMDFRFYSSNLNASFAMYVYSETAITE